MSLIFRFNISFEFRTFHQEGVFFFIGNPSNINGDYVAAQIYRGYVMVMFKYDGDIYSVNSTIKTADGDWHSVQVLKGTKNVKLQVDKNTKRIPIKRKLNINAPVFVGGVSEELRQRPELVQHSLRGCLKNYYINDQMILIKDAKIVKGVTKCYVNVEPGVYFTGSAYGIIGMLKRRFPFLLSRTANSLKIRNCENSVIFRWLFNNYDVN